jgi:hypothetical protein
MLFLLLSKSYIFAKSFMKKVQVVEVLLQTCNCLFSVVKLRASAFSTAPRCSKRGHQNCIWRLQ